MRSFYIQIFICFVLIPFKLFALQITNLTCNYERSPISVDDHHPSLSWQILSQERGTFQKAYRLIVSSSVKNLNSDNGDVWDTGKIKSEQSRYVRYYGKSLSSEKAYFWKVQIWDEHGKLSLWSNMATWRMGLLNASDWKAKWITASKWFMPPELRPNGFQLSAKGGWADVDLVKPTQIDKACLFPLDSASFPKRFKILGSNEFNFVHSQVLIDQSTTDYKIEGLSSQQFLFRPAKFRFIRLLILPGKKSTIVRQMQVFSGSDNVALMKFTREYNTAWNLGHSPFLVDGMPSQNEGSTCPLDACPSDAAPEFRKEFLMTKKIKSATLYFAALGMVDVTMNGQKVTDDVLGPPFTDYTKHIMYVTYDITSLVKLGKNVIGAVLGNGFFSTPRLGFGQRQNGNGPPRFMLQTRVVYTDGSQQWIVTDSSWKWTRSEITFNDIWAGYTENRNLAKPGWKMSNYDDSEWRYVKVTQKLAGKLIARSGPPNKINGIIRPVKVKDNEVYFEAASVGWPLLKINGRAGQKITITGDGPGYKMAKLTFILAKNGPTLLSPNFIIQPGPVHMVLDGLCDSLKIEDVSIQYVNADLKETSAFICSNAELNELFAITLRTHRNYVNDFPADPNREKQGWTQDAQNMFNTAAYLTDVRELYQRWWNDMADSQDEQGYLGTVVPMVNRQVYDWNSPWWSGMIVFLPWEHYQYFGNPEILRNGYHAMRSYVDFLNRIARTGEGRNWDDYTYFTQNLDTLAAKEKMIIWNGAGDWNNPFTKSHYAIPAPMATMPAWYLYARIVSKSAALLGKKGDEKKYAALARDIKNRFNAKYLHPANGLYGDSTNSQTAQVLPLTLGMVPKNEAGLTYQRLLDAIHARNDHIGTGFISINYLLQTLASHRESALANKMIHQQDYPGWKTLTKGGVFQERWSGAGAQMPSCGGAVGAWLFQSVLGIQPDPEHPGFKQFILSPQPDKTTGLLSASGYYDSPYGRISIIWKYLGNRFTATIEIPANTSVKLYIPSDFPSSTKESGRSLARDKNIRLMGFENKVACYQVKSGKYQFETIYTDH